MGAMITAGDATNAAIDVPDVRFRMSRLLDGSGAMDPDPDTFTCMFWIPS